MQAEHGNDIVPPPTCSFNYIALRYSEFPPEIIFQYGSVVLFSIADHEAEYYLDIIRKHASGWLPETRKDGMPSLLTAKLCLFTAFYLPPFLCSLITFAWTENSIIAFFYIQDPIW